MNRKVAEKGDGKNTSVQQQKKTVFSHSYLDCIEQNASRKPEDPLTSQATKQDRMLSLQNQAGNHAVSGLWQPVNPDYSTLSDSQPIPDEPRNRLQHAFNADLSDVRIETNSARVRNSGVLALTHGSTISFAPGAFAPNSSAGFYLLAHETAHIVQQATATHVRSRANSASTEREAWRAADTVVAGGSPSIASEQVVPNTQAAEGMSPLVPRPFAIEMEWTPGAPNTTKLGFKRDEKQFWKRYAEKYGDHISPENRARIEGKKFHSPRVDKTWIKYYPQDALYEGDLLEHHHAGQSSRAVGIPKKLHDAYTSVHPQETVVATPGGPPAKALGPLPTQQRTEKENARHTEAGRIRTATGKPPQASIIPSTSELMSLPEGQRRPIDTTDTVTIRGQTYLGERAINENRYPRAKYIPLPIPGEAKPNPSLVPLTPEQEQDWSDIHPGKGPKSPLEELLDKAPKRGGKTIQLGKAMPTVLSPASPQQQPKTRMLPAGKAAVEQTVPPILSVPKTLSSTEGKSVSFHSKAPALAGSAPFIKNTPALSSATLVPRLRAVSTTGLMIAKNVGMQMGVGLLAAYLKSERDRKEIQKDLEMRWPEIERRVMELEPEISNMQSKFPEATIYANVTLIIMRSRSITNNSESIAGIGDLSVAVSMECFETSESDVDLKSKPWYEKLFIHATQMTFSVPLSSFVGK